MHQNAIHIWSAAQSISSFNIGINESPLRVMEYSTFGGTDGYSLRLISPSDSKDFKVELNTFGEISGNARDISLNRRQRYSPSIEIISKPHFVLKWHNTLRMGQWPMSEYFFIESVIYFNLSISNTNSEVTIYHPCKFLHIIFSIYNFSLSKS